MTSPNPHEPRRSARRIDTLSLVMGLLGLIFGLTVLWIMLVGPISQAALNYFIPACLVAVGLVGLIASRGKS